MNSGFNKWFYLNKILILGIGTDFFFSFLGNLCLAIVIDLRALL